MTRIRFILLALACSCGTPEVEWAGTWKEPTGLPASSYVECTLGGSGTTISGSGVQHREAGADLPFGVSGTTGGVTFNYQGGTTENFSFTQPDPDHITLSNPQRTIALARQ